MRLSGLVVCKDEERRIARCLDSLAFCDELVVVDSGSRDRTLDLARARGARILERPWRDANDQKDFGRQACEGEWVLNLDADEELSPELAQEIRQLIQGSGEQPPCAAYRAPFHNYFRNRWVRRAGYYPDPHVRLLRRDRARWDVTAGVHDRVLADGPVGLLQGHVEHHSFESVDHFLRKSRLYAQGFAERAHRAGRRAGLLTIAGHTAFRFFRAYVLQGGFLEGSLGLVISLLQAFEVFQKYARLWELTRFERAGEGGG